MRRIVPILAAVVFLAAMILDTAAVLRIAAIYVWMLLRAHPLWALVAAGAMAAAVLWPYRPWQPGPARRGKRRKRNALAQPRKRPSGGKPAKPRRRADAAPAGALGTPVRSSSPRSSSPGSSSPRASPLPASSSPASSPLARTRKQRAPRHGDGTVPPAREHAAAGDRPPSGADGAPRRRRKGASRAAPAQHESP